MTALVQKHRTWPAHQVANELVVRGYTNVGERTIQRYLKTIKWSKRLPLAVPPLKPAHKTKRVAWCRKHLRRSWNHVIFSDESTFQLFTNKTKLWGKKRQIKGIPKHPPSIMIWGAISSKGLSKLVFINGKVNSEKYIDILKEALVNDFDKYYPRGWVFQQDNAPVHTSRYSKTWLAQHCKIIDWPALSPDLNPIENVWGYIKQSLKHENPKNLTELKILIQQKWDELPLTYLKSLIGSMKTRLKKMY